MPTFPNTTSAYGRWNLLDARDAQMGSNWPKVRDSNFSNVSLLLSGDGVNDNPNNFITDSSSNNFNLVVAGDTKSVGFHPYLEGWSNYFDGSGDYLSVATSTAFGLGTGNFTIECWICPTANAANGIGTVFDLRTGQTASATTLRINSSLQLIFYNGPVNVENTFTAVTVAMGIWSHIAIVRSGNTVSGYINGVLAGSASVTSDLGTTQPVRIGSNYAAGYDFNGYISNLRIIKGIALYLTNFTPPTVQLTAVTNTSLLTCTSNRFRDLSTNNFTVTPSGNVSVVSNNPYNLTNSSTNYGSAYFDGTGDYLTIGSNSAFGYATGDFTIEFWVYFNTVATDQTIFSNLTSASSINPHIWLSGATNQTIRYYTGNADRITGGVLVANRWYHIAVTKASGSTKLFIDGTQSGSTYSDTNNYGAASTAGIGTYFNAGSPVTTLTLNGYLSNLRVIKGTALYTANFTPPTQPLTPVTNTSLLTCQYKTGHNNNNFLDESRNNLVVARTGSPTQGSFSPYGDRWSAYFGGSSDMLTVSSLPGPLTGDFTYECWAYPIDSTVSYRAIFGIDNYSGTTPFRLYQYGPKFEFWYTGTSPNYRSSNTITMNQWYHLAITRAGTSLRFYVNGEQMGTTVTSSANYPTSNFRIGFDFQSLYPFLGYISNVRVVNGTALYTSNFTPPTAQLTAISGTTLLTCQNNRFRDNSTNNYTVTPSGNVSIQPFGPFLLSSPYSTTSRSGSIYFDGTSSIVGPASNPQFAVSANEDFTLECWVYLSELNTDYAYMVDFIDASSNILQIRVGNSGFMYKVQATLGPGASASSVYDNASYTRTNLLGVWTHLALCRSGGTARFFFNGVEIASKTGVNTITVATPTTSRLGRSSPEVFKGYVSNVRYLKGTALYTAGFTPPTSPLALTSNTVLLINGTNGAIVDHTGLNNIITVGDAEVYTAQSKWGSSSMYFDGTGDYLTIPDSELFNFGTGNFTVECWLYVQNAASSPWIVGQWNTSAGSDTNSSWVLLINSSNLSFAAAYNNSISQTSVTTPNIQNNTWYHVAAVRNGSTLSLYLNGSLQQSNTTLGSSTLNNSSLNVNIGQRQGGTNYLVGYIDDLRVTKGIARYTSNFTPSSVNPRL